MTSKDAAAPIDSLDDTSAQLDQAIDELRGVLKEEKTGRAQARTGEQAGRTATMKTAPATAFADFGEETTRDDTAAAHGNRDTRDHERRLDVVMDIPIDVQIVLGSSRMPVSALMNLSEGATIALDRKIGEPVEITVNGRVVGHGEITVLEDDDTRFGIRLIDMLAPSKG